jgi:hypothetical protein
MKVSGRKRPSRGEIPDPPEKTAAAQLIRPSRGWGRPRGEVPGWAGQAEEDAGPPGRGGLPGRGPEESAGRGNGASAQPKSGVAGPAWCRYPGPTGEREDGGPAGLNHADPAGEESFGPAGLYAGLGSHMPAEQAICRLIRLQRIYSF